MKTALSILVLSLGFVGSMARAHDTSSSPLNFHGPPSTPAEASAVFSEPYPADQWTPTSTDVRDAIHEAIARAVFYDCDADNDELLHARNSSVHAIHLSYARTHSSWYRRNSAGQPLFHDVNDGSGMFYEISLNDSQTAVTEIVLRQFTLTRTNFGSITNPDYRNIATEQVLQDCHAR